MGHSNSVVQFWLTMKLWIANGRCDEMAKGKYFDSHRRTVAKSLLWRFVGIFWTWGGAYVIILLLPNEQQNAITIATLVTVWHHSTRMIMYYLYERAWIRISWGTIGENHSKTNLSAKQKLQWIFGIVAAIITIFWLLFFVSPDIKNNQKELLKERTVTASRL